MNLQNMLILFCGYTSANYVDKHLDILQRIVYLALR